MWKPHFLSFPPITSRLAQPARPWSAPLRPNLISNSHPSTWLGLWDCLSTCHQPSHSIWFCQPTARLVSTAPRVRFNYVLWNPTDFYIYWRYWVDRMYVGTAGPCSVMKAAPALCLAGGKDISSQLLSGSFVPLPLGLHLFKCNPCPCHQDLSHSYLGTWRIRDFPLRHIHSLPAPLPRIHPFPKYLPHPRHWQPKAYSDLESVQH